MAIVTTSVLKWLPSAALGASVTMPNVAWTNSAWVQINASTANPTTIYGINVTAAAAAPFEVDIATGASGSEQVVTTIRGDIESLVGGNIMNLTIPYGPIAAATRIAIRVRANTTTTTAWRISLGYYENYDSDYHIAKPQVDSSPASLNTSVTPSATTWANSSWYQVIASAPKNTLLTGVPINPAGAAGAYEIDVATGASGSEVVIQTIRGRVDGLSGYIYQDLPLPYVLSNATRLAVRLRKDNTNTTVWNIGVTTIGNDDPPAAPTLTTADASTFSIGTPTVQFYTTDPDSDDIAYEIQIDSANTFDSQ